MKKIFYDFECFCKDWLVVFIDYDTKDKTVIVNDRGMLQGFYNRYKDDIFIGFNSRSYDQFIFKGILDNQDPYEINKAIIIDGINGYKAVKNANKYQLYNFDVMVTRNYGLKQREAFLGSTIKESSIPFNINRKLTKDEIEETKKYCTHDVEQTIIVFDQVKEEFDSQLSLIEMFSLPMTEFTKTKAQISAQILGARRVENRGDEFNITFPNTLKIDKYKCVWDWYKDENNREYNKELNINIAGVPHTFAWGGVHGALTNYQAKGIILCCDVASLYPSIMIEYGFLSRNVTHPEKFKEIRDMRLELKAKKDKRQAPLKIVINGTYGASKDEHNDLYDPLMANNVCIAGQLLLLDLIEKVEPYGKLIQSNTDGIYLLVKDFETVEIIKEIASEWEKRTRLSLEWDVYKKIYQKDVNNYIIISEDGHYKSKGAYVKKLSLIDYNLPIINKALINYFTENKPIADTINECDDLIEFQQVCKVSSLYKYGMYGDAKLNERVLRVFASRSPDAKGVFKVKEYKGEDSIAKMPDTPDKAFIWNDSVIGFKVPEFLDKQYYINMAEKRLRDFLDEKEIKKANPKSFIKGINENILTELETSYEKNFPTFIQFIVYLTENTSANKTQIETAIRLNMFKKYGGNLKLLKIFNEFSNGKNKYNKNVKQESKNKKIENLELIESSIENEVIPIVDQIKYEIEKIGVPHSTYNLPKGTGYLLDVSDSGNYSVKVKIYGLVTGTIIDMKINRSLYETKLAIGDIIKVLDFNKKADGYFENNKWVYKPNSAVYWIKNYSKVCF